MAGRLGNEEPLHRAGLALGEWLLRVLQRKTQGRVPQWRDLLQLEGGANHHRKLAQSLQYQAPTLCAWLSTAGTARDRTKARPSGHHELISQCVWYKKSVRPRSRQSQRSVLPPLKQLLGRPRLCQLSLPPQAIPSQRG